LAILHVSLLEQAVKSALKPILDGNSPKNFYDSPSSRHYGAI